MRFPADLREDQQMSYRQLFIQIWALQAPLNHLLHAAPKGRCQLTEGRHTSQAGATFCQLFSCPLLQLTFLHFSGVARDITSQNAEPFHFFPLWAVGSLFGLRRFFSEEKIRQKSKSALHRKPSTQLRRNAGVTSRWESPPCATAGGSSLPSPQREGTSTTARSPPSSSVTGTTVELPAACVR